MLLPLLLTVHIAAGTLSLAAALTAMASRKQGGALHARAGGWFVSAMSVMAASAAVLTWWEPDLLSLGAALWTLYLVQTARAAAAARQDGPFDRGARLSLLAGGAALAAFGYGGFSAATASSGEYQGMGLPAYVVFGLFAALSLGLDASLSWRQRLEPKARIARHLWRMTTACFLAVTSLFLGQQDDVFPFMAGSPVLLLPSLLTLGFLLFWILRIRFVRNGLRPVFSRRPLASSTLEKDPA